MDVSKRTTHTGPPGRSKQSGLCPAPRLTERDWIELYTRRVLDAWCCRETPLGLARAYAECVRKDLAGYYRQPLIRAFIEETY